MVITAWFVPPEPSLLNKILTMVFIPIVPLALIMYRKQNGSTSTLYGSEAVPMVAAIFGLAAVAGLNNATTDILDTSYVPLALFPFLLIWSIWASLPFFRKHSLKSLIGVAAALGLFWGTYGYGYTAFQAINLSFSSDTPEVIDAEVIDKQVISHSSRKRRDDKYRVILRYPASWMVVGYSDLYHDVNRSTYGNLKIGGRAEIHTYNGALGVRFRQVHTK